MNLALAPAWLLAAGTLLACVRTWRARPPRALLRCLLQVAVAAALWLCLQPPSRPQTHARDELTVLTPAASPAQVAAAAGTLVALPGVEAPRGVERVADLGSALRAHPQARSLRVIGGGLPARDRDVAAGRVGAFEAAPLPPGIAELDAPGQAVAGTQWRVRGRIEGAGGATLELRDPAGARVANAGRDAQGRFELLAGVGVAGSVTYTLRALDAQGAVLDEVPLPLHVRAGSRLRLLVLAGAPDPQLKYLRRWALDAGLELDSRIGLSSGVALLEGQPRLDAATLAATDLVIVDERAWAGLDAAYKDALRAAVHEGLGLLLRVRGAVPDAVARDWRALGFAVRALATAREVALGQALGPRAAPLVALPFVLDAPDAAPLLRGDDATPLASWRALQRGRVGAMWFDGDWKLALAGEGAAHAGLWSRLVAQLARAQVETAPQLPERAQAGARAVLCGVQATDTVVDPQGRSVPLLTVAQRDGRHCAGYWPATTGWHVLLRGSERWPFAVLQDPPTHALARAAQARATRALLGTAPAPELATRAVPWPRWPFWLAFLALATLLWWLERPRQ